MAGKSLEYKVDIKVDDAELRKMGEEFEKAGKAAKQAFTGLTGALAASNADINGLEDNLKGTTKAFLAIKKASGDAFDDDSIIAYVGQLAKLGAEFDEIEANADQVAASLKRATDVNMGATLGGDAERVSASMGRVRQSTDDVSASAEKSKNAMANMVGNAAQDLGALGGIAGSAGVALGQLAEGAADAANSGESLGNVFKGVAGSLGPIAALSVGVGLATKLWSNYQAAQAEVKRQTEDVAQSLIELGGIVDQVNESLAQQAEVGDFGDKLINSLTLTDEKIVDILGSATQLGIAFTDVGDIIAGMGDKGDLQGFDLLVTSIQKNLGITREQAEGVAEAVSASGSNWDLLNQAVRNNTDLTDDQIDALKDQIILYGRIGQAAKDTDINKAAQQYLNTLKLTKDGLQQIADATARLKAQGILDPSAIQISSEISRGNVEVARSLDDLNRSAHESQQITKATAQNWKILLDDLADGTIDTQTAADAWNILQTALHLTDDQMQELVDSKLDEQIQADADAAKDAAAKMDDLADAVGSVNQEVNTADFRASAIQDVFDTLNRFGELDTADQLNATASAFDAIDKAAKDFPDSILPFDLIPDDFGDVENLPDKLAPITGAIEDFAQAAQTQMASAFSFGGPSAMRKSAEDIRQNFHQPFIDMMERNGASAKDAEFQWLQFLDVIGLTPSDVEVEINLAIDEQKLAIIQGLAEGQLTGDALLNFNLAIANKDPEAALEILNGQIATVVDEEGDARQISLVVNAETGEVTGQIAEIDPEPITVPTQTGVPDTTASDTFFSSLWTTPEVKPVEIVATSATLGPLNAFMNAVAEKKRVAEFKAESRTLGPLNTYMNAVADQRTAHFFAQADNVTETDESLDKLAMPKESGRNAFIFAQATNVAPTDTALDNLAAKRTAHIALHTEPNVFDLGRALDDMAHDRTTTITINTVGGATAPPTGPGPDTLGVDTFAAPGVTALAEVTPLAGDTTSSLFGTPVSISGGGGSTSTVTHNHVTVQAAVIGSRFDVQRAVTKALRQAQRLNGVRVA